MTAELTPGKSLESAVPEHLRIAVTRPTRRPSGYTPPYPSFSARFDPSVRQVVMAYFGLQFPDGEAPGPAAAALVDLDEAMTGADGSGCKERATYLDEAGYRTLVTTAYWDDPDAYERWDAGPGAFWLRAPATPGTGRFAEVLLPTVERYETLFSNDRVEGVSRLAAGLSGEILEHGYWGGSRDRIPLAQTDALTAGGPPVAEGGDLVVVRPQENLCLIRSGQEWTETDGEERRMYLEDVEPVLRAGMDYLRDEGLAIGCYANRYLRVLNPDGTERDQTYGMSWWRSMEALDEWAEHHPTHKAIFGSAMKYLSTMGPAARLRLFHEVTVAGTGQQRFAYLGCHPRTGLLRTRVVATDERLTKDD